MPSVDESDLDTARGLRLAVGRLARRVRRLFVDGDEGLAFLELGVLDHLDRSGPSSPSSLAGGEGVTAPAVAATLRHLESLRLIKRSQDRADGRRIVVTITAAGRRSLHARDLVVLSRIREIVRDDLTQVERTRLAAAIPVIEKVASLL